MDLASFYHSEEKSLQCALMTFLHNVSTTKAKSRQQAYAEMNYSQLDNEKEIF